MGVVNLAHYLENAPFSVFFFSGWSGLAWSNSWRPGWWWSAQLPVSQMVPLISRQSGLDWPKIPTPGLSAKGCWATLRRFSFVLNKTKLRRWKYTDEANNLNFQGNFHQKKWSFWGEVISGRRGPKRLARTWGDQGRFHRFNRTVTSLFENVTDYTIVLWQEIWTALEHFWEQWKRPGPPIM